MKHIRKIGRLAIVTAMCVGMAACGTLTAAQVASLVQEVRNETLAVCSFVPTVASVTTLIGAFVPQANAGINIGNQIAQAICKGAATSSAPRFKRGAAAPVTIFVQGIKVEGTFVAK